MSKPRRALLSRLSKHFDLPIASIEFVETGRSKAYVVERELIISDASPYGPVGVCLHEFAHLLAERRRPGHGHRHGLLFRQALLDCCAAVGMEPHTYPWHQEYTRLRQWARKAGLW